MDLTDHELRMRILPWVQKHTILRRSVPFGEMIAAAQYYGEWTGLVSDNEAMEELLEAIRA